MTTTATNMISVRLASAVRGAAFAVAAALLTTAPAAAQTSIARQWDEAILSAIRIDTPRPPVHARNLYHVSAAMYDAWAAYDATARGQFVDEKHTAGDVAAARDEAIAYAAYRVLSDRYQLSHSPLASQQIFDDLLGAQGYDKNVTTTVGDSPAAVGNRIAQQILDGTLNDGSNEANNYADPTGYTAVNTPMLTGFATPTDQIYAPLADPNRWQPLYVEAFTNQNGIVDGSNLQQYIAPHWGPVTPFSMQSASGPYSWSDVDPGPQPHLGGVGDAEYRDQAMTMLRLSNSLDPSQGPGAEMVNLSPAVNGNRVLGTYDSQGYASNPVTGQPYADNFVKRADYGRVLAEFWADGPHSETPPGHWNVLANEVSDDPRLTRQIGGDGPELDRLEWDVKMYLALNGAVHDAAIAAWGLKREYDSARPITMIRYMGHLGQSSDPNLPSYDPLGLPLEDGLVELITLDSVSPGGKHRNVYDNVNRDHNGDYFPFFNEVELVGKLAVHAWAQPPADPATEFGGTDWILAENWLPYQMENFVSPAFPGYISGHSTFSRAAAEVLALFTGSEYFPGGLGELTFTPDFLKFEDGPTEALTLQWATYFDAADEAGVSRLWGGIHPPMDDLPGRIIGDWVGRQAFATARNRFLGVPEPAVRAQAGILAVVLVLGTMRPRGGERLGERATQKST
ncbi:MAG: vanadium-dependent haloperoxidase [Planctomycetales bacterium]|nr:vanadium-dependent haloperoxidase [Planctomycetales bacterium]